MDISTGSQTFNPAGSPKVTKTQAPGDAFKDALRTVLSVSKKDVDKAIVREKKAREAGRTEQPK